MAEDWAAPEPAVLDAAADALEAGRDAVLATVVAVEGNAYRRPGAKMLVSPGGDGVGAITPGCLSETVRDRAESVLATGERRVETYDLRAGEDRWGLGVGCEGVLTVLLEPVDDALAPLAAAHREREPVAAVTVLDGPREGSRAYYRPDSDDGTVLVGADGQAGADGALEAAIEERAERFLDAGRSGTVEVDAAGEASTAAVDATGEATTAFVDSVVPAPELVVAGTGHEVGPLVELANRNGFRTTVVGFRGGVDLADRFPAADRTVTTGPADLADDLDIDERTYAVVATHNFVDDRLAVEGLLDTPCPYVGLVGPRERFEEMRETFDAEGQSVENDLDAVYTPAGLDLGAGSPYGIATSVVSEVLAVHNDRTPRHLRSREGPIHDRPDGNGSA